MKDEFFTNEITYDKKRKLWLEFKDLMAGVAFPIIIMVILSCTVIAFASYDKDLSVTLLALVGGELMLAAALVYFGRANGSEAYRKTVENGRKRALNSSDEQAVYHTGEYALWKGIVTGLIVCVPFIIIQSIELCFDNAFCNFCLQYIFSWAYYPFSFLGKGYQALNYILILLPVGTMTLGYYLGKLKQLKIQEELAKTNPDRANRKGKK